MNLNVEDVVWAKMNASPFWPPVITKETSTGFLKKGVGKSKSSKKRLKKTSVATSLRRSRRNSSTFARDEPDLMSSLQWDSDWKKPFKCRLCHIRFGWKFERDSHELICTDVESPASTVLSPNSEKVSSSPAEVILSADASVALSPNTEKVSSSIAEIVLSPPALKVPSPNTEKVPSSSAETVLSSTAEMVFSPTDETVFSATDETVFSPTDETVLMDEVTTTLHFHNSTTVQNTPTKTTPYSKKSAYICGTCSKSYIRKDHYLTHVINCTRNKLRNIKPRRQHQRKLTVSSPRVSAEVAHAYAFKESMKDGENDDASNIVNVEISAAVAFDTAFNESLKDGENDNTTYNDKVEISSAVALDTAFKESSKEGENNNATKNVEISAAITLDTGFKESMKDGENDYATSFDKLEINRKSLGNKEENNDTTIIVSDDEDMTPRKFQDPNVIFSTPMSSVSTNENTTILKKRRMESLVTTINVSDSDDEETLTLKKSQKGNKKIVKKRLFPCYPLRQNQIPNDEWQNEDNPRSTKLSTSEVGLIKSSQVGDSTKRYEEAMDKIKLLGSGISLTSEVSLIKSSQVDDSTKKYEEAVNKIKLLGSGISLTRLVELELLD